jgi:hypothetical protein
MLVLLDQYRQTLHFAEMLSLAQVGKNIVFAGSNVRAQNADRLRRVAPLHGLNQLKMFLVGGEAAGRVVKAVGASFQYDPFKYLSQRAD